MWPWRRVVARGVIDVEAVHAVRHEIYLPYAQQVVSEHGLAPERAEDLLPSTLEMAGWLRTDSREAFVARLDAEFRRRLERATYWWPWSEISAPASPEVAEGASR